MTPETEGRGHRDFYAPPPWPAPGGEVRLPAEEAAHALRVLRLRVGDRLRLVDGEGREAAAEVARVGRGVLEARLGEARRCPRELARHIALGLPVLRAPTRLDWAIEKAVECGVHAIHLFAAARGVKAGAPPSEARMRRWRGIARAAMKQSGRARWPAVAAHASLAALLEAVGARAAILLADAGGEPASGCDTPAGFASLLLLVGPEGGLTAGERQALEGRGARPIALGPHRLRAETAGVALCAWAAAQEWARARAATEEN
jgi:16S rRNA (uracil1498-N3)-methyltransferase